MPCPVIGVFATMTRFEPSVLRASEACWSASEEAPLGAELLLLAPDGIELSEMQEAP